MTNNILHSDENNDKNSSELSSSLSFLPKIIFFDIDDTLSRNGVIDPYNKQTLIELSKTNIKLSIATGRSKSIIPQDIMEMITDGIFDAVVCTNGQYSFSNDNIISHYPLTLEQAQKIHEICLLNNIIHKFDSAQHLAWANDDKRVRAFCEITPSSIVDPDYFKSNAVYQCSVFFNDQIKKMNHVDFSLYGLKLVEWHKMGGDILPIEASKARGASDICDYFNISLDDAVAIGDGFNDLELFDAVGYSVAMGDGQPALKERANFITGSIEEHGLQTFLDPIIDSFN